MKRILVLVYTFVAMSSLAHAVANPQTFRTSAGEVKITPLYHASTRIEAGGKPSTSTPMRSAFESADSL